MRRSKYLKNYEMKLGCSMDSSKQSNYESIKN